MRNEAERLFRRLLDCLRIRMGFDKLDGMFPAFPDFVAIVEMINDLV